MAVAINNVPPHACPVMRTCLEDTRVPIKYSGVRRTYEIRVFNGLEQFDPVQMLDFCPWCGAKLPADLSDEWFDELERLLGENYDLLGDPEDRVPSEYKSDRWWQGRFTDNGDLT